MNTIQKLQETWRPTMNLIPTRQQVNVVHNRLASTGWSYSHSISHADSDDDYGSVFIYRGGPLRVYVNRVTMRNLQAYIQVR
jgi:hypothetical protein